MNKSIIFLCTFFAVFLSSCKIVGGIFKAGVGFGVIAVVVVIIIVGWIVSKAGGKS